MDNHDSAGPYTATGSFNAALDTIQVEERSDAYRTATDLYFSLVDVFNETYGEVGPPSLDDTETNVRILADWLLQGRWV